MTIDRIECTGTFQIHEGYWFKAYWGGTITESEDPETETLNLKNRLEEMAKKFGVHPRQVSVAEAMPYSSIVTGRSRDEIIAAHLLTIKECKTLRNLEMFANMVQRENEPVLFEAYNNKKKELSNG